MQAIAVKDLVKDFKGLKAVDGISFEVKQGEIFAFLGPNGAGKTTTIKMLTTLSRPTAGSVSVNGYNPLYQQADVRKSFGIVFQDPSLDDELTAMENLEFHAALYGVPKEVAKERISYLFEFVGLESRKHFLVKTFSGGMKRRLEIARGLIHHPKILFLDEPTLGLDPQTRKAMWKHILELNKKESMTVFLTTHYLEEAEKMADRIAIIDLGKIVAQGALSEIKKSTKSKTLEEAFIKPTGHSIREESATAADHMRQAKRMWGR